jgi:hypothetical protein
VLRSNGERREKIPCYVRECQISKGRARALADGTIHGVTEPRSQCFPGTRSSSLHTSHHDDHNVSLKAFKIHLHSVWNNLGTFFEHAAMPSPYAGNTYLPFVDLIKLEKVDERTYRSIAQPFSPGGDVGLGRSYGGHVFMQAAWAACQTVAPGFLLHVSSRMEPSFLLICFCFGKALLMFFAFLAHFRKLHTWRPARRTLRIQSAPDPRWTILCHQDCQCHAKRRQRHMLYVHMLLQDPGEKFL